MSEDVMTCKDKTYRRVPVGEELRSSDLMLSPMGLCFFAGESHARRDNILYYREVQLVATVPPGQSPDDKGFKP